MEILAFHCNQFAEEEPWDHAEIKEFIKTKLNVDFEIFQKIEVNGYNSHPIYPILKYNSSLRDSETGET